MKVFYILASVLCVWITPAYSQFFYSHYGPLTSHLDPVLQHMFLSSLPRARTVPTVSFFSGNAPQNKPTSTLTSTVTYHLPSITKTEYRGFGYHTEYKEGASSTVFYISGPKSENLKNFKKFSNFNKKNKELSSEKARNLASNILDINAVTDAPLQIENILQPTDFQKLFDSAFPGIVNFYTLPAGTASLTKQSLQSHVGTTTAATVSAAEETEVAGSAVNARILEHNSYNEEISNHTSTEIAVSTTKLEYSGEITSTAATSENELTTIQSTTLENITEA